MYLIEARVLTAGLWLGGYDPSSISRIDRSAFSRAALSLASIPARNLPWKVINKVNRYMKKTTVNN